MRSHCGILTVVNIILCIATCFTYMTGNYTALHSDACHSLFLRSYLISATLFHGIFAGTTFFLYQQHTLTSRERLAMTLSAFLLGILSMSILTVFSLIVAQRMYRHSSAAMKCHETTSAYNFAQIEIMCNLIIAAFTYPRVGQRCLAWMNAVFGQVQENHDRGGKR